MPTTAAEDSGLQEFHLAQVSIKTLPQWRKTMPHACGNPTEPCSVPGVEKLSKQDVVVLTTSQKHRAGRDNGDCLI